VPALHHAISHFLPAFEALLNLLVQETLAFHIIGKIGASNNLHKFAIIVVAGDVDPGLPQRGQLQHGLLQITTRPITQIDFPSDT